MGKLLEVVLISLSVSVDAFAVCVAAGLCARGGAALKAMRLPLFFGLFQLIMPLAGFKLASLSLAFISSFDHWVGFLLLSVVGSKMVLRGIRGEIEAVPLWEEIGPMKLLIFSLATSLDAFAVGMAFPSLEVPPALTSLSMGAFTAAISSLGLLLGCRISSWLGSGAEVFGGLVLVALGFKVLLEHLG